MLLQEGVVRMSCKGGEVIHITLKGNPSMSDGCVVFN